MSNINHANRIAREKMQGAANFKGALTDAAQMLDEARGAISERQYVMLLHYLRGGSKSEAAEAAGYAREASSQAFRSVKVQAALSRIMDRFLVGELMPLALRTAHEILSDTKAPAGVRSTLLVSIMDRAGFSPKRFERAGELAQDIGAMSALELRQALAKIDHELTTRMVDVTPNSEPMTSDELDIYS